MTNVHASLHGEASRAHQETARERKARVDNSPRRLVRHGTTFWKPQLALLVNERTLMPMLLPLAPANTLAERLGPVVAALLHQYGMALPLIDRELAAMAEVEIAKTSNC